MSGEHAVHGFANRGLRVKLTDRLRDDPKQQSAQISRLLHRLHVYGLVAKIPRSRRWRVTAFGHRVMGASVRLRPAGLPCRLRRSGVRSPETFIAKNKEPTTEESTHSTPCEVLLAVLTMTHPLVERRHRKARIRGNLGQPRAISRDVHFEMWPRECGRGIDCPGSGTVPVDRIAKALARWHGPDYTVVAAG